MKTRALLTLALTLSAFSAFATTEIPKTVIDRHSAICSEFSSEERGEYMTREAHTLPDGNKLYVLGCELYAYNSLEKAYIVNSYGDIANVAVVEVGADGSLTATSDLMGAGFDPATLTLGTFQKGRGVGDCGSMATYQYDSRAEKFVLLEARVKESCDGEVDSDWPLVYKR